MAHADDEALLDPFEARQMMRELRALARPDPARTARVVATDHEVPATGDHPAVPVRVYRPRGGAGPSPVVLSVHGGAFVAGAHDDTRAGDESLVDRLGCVVVVVDYRLAPEARFPAAADDTYRALCWVAQEAIALGIDPNRLVVLGSSAGGALAVAACLMARDRGGPVIAAQVLLMPVLDDRLATGSIIEMADHPGFDGRGARGMWAHYLGDIDRRFTPAYAAPARADDLRGLPRAYVRVHELDALRDEGIEYATRLLAAGVRVELHCLPGLFHGAPPLDPRVPTRADTELYDVLRELLAPPDEA